MAGPIAGALIMIVVSPKSLVPAIFATNSDARLSWDV
jgi:hypothetical protein